MVQTVLKNLIQVIKHILLNIGIRFLIIALTLSLPALLLRSHLPINLLLNPNPLHIDAARRIDIRRDLSSRNAILIAFL